jgi:ABC-2 type transport system permease protein
MITSFFIAFSSSVSGGGDTTLAKVSSFLPPVAPLIMPLRIAGGNAAPWEIALSLAIMLVSIVAVVLLAARLYEGAILRTGARVKLSDAWRSGRRQPATGRA